MIKLSRSLILVLSLATVAGCATTQEKKPKSDDPAQQFTTRHELFAGRET